MDAPHDINGFNPYDHDGSFYFDPVAAQRPIEFCERWLKHTSGELALKPFLLQPWQKNIVQTLFGWKHSSGPRQGLRRFKSLLLEVPRGNGKTSFSSFLANYMLGFDKQYGAQVYLAGVTQDQARLTLDMCNQQVRLSKPLQKFYDVREARNRIICRKMNSYIQAISSDAAAAHGKITHCAICDELHEWQGFRGREFFQTIETSLGKLLQPLLVVTSTAGHDRTSQFWDLHQHSTRVIQKPSVDYSHLPVIYAAKETDNWQDIEVAKRVNPNWGLGVKPDYIAAQLKRAIDNPLEENKYKRLHLDLWTENADRVIQMADWDACPTEDLELYNQPCVGGLDTSSSKDLTAFGLYFPLQKAVRVWFWVPGEHARQKSLIDGVDYLTWEKNPRANLVFVRSKIIKRDQILEKILELKTKYKIQAVAYDPWERKLGIVDDLSKKGIRVIDHGQQYSVMNAPTKIFIEMVINHELNHGDNPCLSWCVSNLCVQTLKEDFVRPTQPEDDSKRIDGCIAAIMAIGISKSIQSVQIYS